MSEYPIPEDLQIVYKHAKLPLTLQLIERIARLEQEKKDDELAFNHAQDVNARLSSENQRLRQALEKIAANGPTEEPDSEKVYDEMHTAGIPEDASQRLGELREAYWAATMARAALAEKGTK